MLFLTLFFHVSMSFLVIVVLFCFVFFLAISLMYLKIIWISGQMQMMVIICTETNRSIEVNFDISSMSITRFGERQINSVCFTGNKIFFEFWISKFIQIHHPFKYEWILINWHGVCVYSFSLSFGKEKSLKWQISERFCIYRLYWNWLSIRIIDSIRFVWIVSFDQNLIQ